MSREWIYAQVPARTSKWPTGAPIWLPFEFCRFARGCFTKKKHVVNQVIAALRWSVGLPGRFVTVLENRTGLTRTQTHPTTVPCSACALRVNKISLCYLCVRRYVDEPQSQPLWHPSPIGHNCYFQHNLKRLIPKSLPLMACVSVLAWYMAQVVFSKGFCTHLYKLVEWTNGKIMSSRSCSRCVS